MERVKSHTGKFASALCEYSLDTSARNASKRSVPQPAPPGCGVSTSAPRKQPRFFSPEGVNPQDFLKGEIHAAAEHSEIIPGPINHAKTQVLSQTNVPRDPKFDAGTELTE